ncbi:hypothetical protein Mpsy_0220 [Methanolobus psychrophilus R15]|nr:hypothetical protein Mpsy_0220 [Methanolobus psychrophilus R15]
MKRIVPRSYTYEYFFSLSASIKIGGKVKDFIRHAVLLGWLVEVLEP